jgi:hypothetical protein
MTGISDVRRCSRCKEVLPFESFHKTKSDPTGYNIRCKECANEVGREWRMANRETSRAHQRKSYRKIQKKTGIGSKRKLKEDLHAKGLRKCSRCKETLPESSFSKDKKLVYGLSATCKLCDSKERPAPFKKLEREALHAEGKRKCSCCKEILPESEFSKDSRRVYGLGGYCKPCDSRKNRRPKSPKKLEKMALHAEGKRKCSCCKEILPESEFNKDSRRVHGLRCECRKCDNKRTRAYAKKNPYIKIGRIYIDPNRDRKVCPGCKEELAIAEFGSNKQATDGHDNMCRPCRAAVQLEYRWKNIDKMRKRERINGRGPISDREKRYKAYYRAKYPHRIKANSAVMCALKKGILKKQPCEECGSDALKSHAHHDDYNKPLDVRWLCSIHHREWHMNNEVIE